MPVRQYYNREYESKPQSPTLNRNSPYHSSSKRSMNTPSYRHDYSRSQHYSPDIAQPVPSLDVTDTSSSSYELNNDMNKQKNKTASEICQSNLFGSPDSVAGLNVRDLASRYGNIGLTSQRSWSLTRSPTKMYRSSTANNRHKSNLDGGTSNHHVETLTHATAMGKQKVMITTRPLSGATTISSNRHSPTIEIHSENDNEFQSQNVQNGFSRSIKNNFRSNFAVFQGTATPTPTETTGPTSNFYNGFDNHTVESNTNKHENKRSQNLQNTKWNYQSENKDNCHQTSKYIASKSTRDTLYSKSIDNNRADSNKMFSAANRIKVGLAMVDKEPALKDVVVDNKFRENKETTTKEENVESNRNVVRKTHFWRNQFTNTTTERQRSTSRNRSHNNNEPKRLLPSRQHEDLDQNQNIDNKEVSNVTVYDNKVCSSPDGKDSRYFNSINTSSTHHLSRQIGYIQTNTRPRLEDSPKAPKAGNNRDSKYSKDEPKKRSNALTPHSFLQKNPKAVNNSQNKVYGVHSDSDTVVGDKKYNHYSQTKICRSNNLLNVKDNGTTNTTHRQRINALSQYDTNENNIVTISKKVSNDENLISPCRDNNEFTGKRNLDHGIENHMQFSPVSQNFVKPTFQGNKIAQQNSETNKKMNYRTISAISSSPSTIIHDRIKKFNSGQEVSLTSPKGLIYNVKSGAGLQKIKVAQQYNQLKRPESSKPSVDQNKTDQYSGSIKGESHNNLGEDGTLADHSLTLSVSEAKALLWDTNEKLIPQCFPPVKGRVTLNKKSAAGLDQPVKAPFKSELFTRAAEATQTVRRTSSMDAGQTMNPKPVSSPHSIRHATSFSPNSRNEKRLNHQTRVASETQFHRHQSTLKQSQPHEPSNPQSGSHNVASSPDHHLPKQQELYESHVTSNPLTNERSNNGFHSNIQRQSNVSSIARLLEKIAAVKRDNPSAALRAIDSILNSERMGLGIIQEDELLSNSPQEDAPQSNHGENFEFVNELKGEDDVDEVTSYYSDYDSDESSVSAITDPSYQSFVADASSVISYSTISRHGKKRQFSYDVQKETGMSQLHLPYSSTRKSSSLHKNRKHDETRPSPLVHQISRLSSHDDNTKSSQTMISPPIVERKASKTPETEQTQHGSIMSSIRASCKPFHGGGGSTNNRGLLQVVSAWDENSDKDDEPIFPGCSERIKKIASKQTSSTLHKNKEATESEKRRFMYPSQKRLHDNNAAKMSKLQHQNEQYENDEKWHTTVELPANVASAFDDVNISFGSENIFAPGDEQEETSFLSPLARKFNKVQKLYNYK